jgi:hypothetical protein
MTITTGTARYRRILVKLSGEALLGNEDYGIDPVILKRIAGEIRDLTQMGVQVAGSWAEAISFAAPAWREPAWTGLPPITWACSPR